MSEGASQLVSKLRQLKKKAQLMNTSVVVGYAAPHAVVVHEDLTMEHEPGKQGKYLEGPARTNAKGISQAMTEEYQKSEDPRAALLAGGMFLLEKSQEVVPVDTGALRASGFVALKENEETAATEAEGRAREILESAE